MPVLILWGQLGTWHVGRPFLSVQRTWLERRTSGSGLWSWHSASLLPPLSPTLQHPGGEEVLLEQAGTVLCEVSLWSLRGWTRPLPNSNLPPPTQSLSVNTLHPSLLPSFSVITYGHIWSYRILTAIYTKICTYLSFPLYGIVKPYIIYQPLTFYVVATVWVHYLLF